MTVPSISVIWSRTATSSACTPFPPRKYNFCRSVAAPTAGISFCSGHPSRSAGGVLQDVGLRCPVTRNPHALWVVQRLRETWANQQPHRFLLFARDAKFDADVVSAVRDMGSEPTRTAFGCPWQNGVTERWVGSCRRDLLNRVIIPK